MHCTQMRCGSDKRAYLIAAYLLENRRRDDAAGTAGTAISRELPGSVVFQGSRRRGGGGADRG